MSSDSLAGLWLFVFYTILMPLAALPIWILSPIINLFK